MASEHSVYNGRYQLVRLLARGGMAEVHLGRDQLLDRPVALKVLSPELSRDEAFVERFRREAQSAANLSHPNIVNVYDWGEEEDAYFIVMEYVPGRTLSQVIRTDGPLPPVRAATIGADIAAALGFAHRNGVIHRDVKPGNVLINDDGQVKVTDFGIARATRSTTAANLTQTGAVLGTATYFSPEQAEGSAVDGRSDVYALGVVLYEMVTGRAPFTGDNPVSIAYKHVREAPAPPRSLRPDLPPALEAVIMRCLAKSPDARYQTADELRSDLLRFSQGLPVAAGVAADSPTTVVAAAAAAAGPPTRVGRTVVTEEEAPPPRDRTGLYAVILLILLAVLGALVFLVVRALHNNTTAAGQVNVPNVVGQQAPAARSALTSVGLQSKEQDVASSAPAGTVFRQDPAAGQTLPRNSVVTIYVSAAAPTGSVPNVVGDDQGTAATALRAAGFQVAFIYQNDPSQPDTVISQDPTGGSQLTKGQTVTLRVSNGPGTTTTLQPSTTTTQQPTTTSSTTTTLLPVSSSTSSTSTTTLGLGSTTTTTRRSGTTTTTAPGTA